MVPESELVDPAILAAVTEASEAAAEAQAGPSGVAVVPSTTPSNIKQQIKSAMQATSSSSGANKEIANSSKIDDQDSPSDADHVAFKSLAIKTFTINGRTVSTPDGIEVTCAECLQNVSAEHFTVEQECTRCHFITNCAESFKEHMMSHAAGRGGQKRLMAEDDLIKCDDTSCTFSTQNGNAMGKCRRRHLRRSTRSTRHTSSQ